jgi:phycocyanin-associated rod protein
MLGQSALVGNVDTPSSGRVFIYEVQGLRQNTTTDNNDYQFRSSSSVFIKVPYSRMNEEMRRITRMGGKIVSIQTESATPSGSDSE